MSRVREMLLAVDPGLDYVAGSWWDVTDWQATSRLELCAARFLGVRTFRTRPATPLAERLRQLAAWMRSEVETGLGHRPLLPDVVVAIELPPIASSYQRNRASQRTKTDPGAASRGPFYAAIGALVAGCTDRSVVLVPPPPGRKKARFAGDLDRRAIVERVLPDALTRGQDNQDVVDSLSIGLHSLTRWPLL